MKIFLRMVFWGFTLVSAACGLKAGTGLQSSNVDPNSLWPLGQGRSWTYRTSVTGYNTICTNNGMVTQSVVGVSILDGETSYTLSAFCDSQTNIVFGNAGSERVDARDGSNWVAALMYPETLSQPWYAGGIEYEYTSQSTIGVPAGNFNGCYTRTVVNNPTNYDVFCPGVGRVISYSMNSLGNLGWTAQLVSKNF